MEIIQPALVVPIKKFDDSQNIFYGWGNVTHKGGSELFDHHEQAVDMPSLIKVAENYMLGDRILKLQHIQDSYAGKMVFCFPMDKDIAKALDIDTDKEGLLVGGKAFDPVVIDLIRKGILRDFSIGGRGILEDV